MVYTVAVIGSGIGAASTCYFLKKKFSNNIDIQVFESSNQIGGRTNSLKIGNFTAEMGAGIAYTGNKYVSAWSKEFGFVNVETVPESFGLWNGNEMVFKGSKDLTITAVKLMLRYGTDLYHMRNFVRKAIAKFDSLYEAQEEGVAFQDSAALWKHVGLYEYTQHSFHDIMSDIIPPSSLLTKELMFAVNKVNYNQTNDISGLAGLGV
jgi:phytoene dehydrogenase-like protein